MIWNWLQQQGNESKVPLSSSLKSRDSSSSGHLCSPCCGWACHNFLPWDTTKRHLTPCGTTATVKASFYFTLCCSCRAHPCWVGQGAWLIAGTTKAPQLTPPSLSLSLIPPPIPRLGTNHTPKKCPFLAAPHLSLHHTEPRQSQ